MSLVNPIVFDPSREIDLYARINRDGVAQTLTFQDSSGNAYQVDTKVWELNIKRTAEDSTNILQLLDGSGLTINTASIVITPTATQTANLQERGYYYELYNSTDKQTWLCGTFYFHKGKFDNYYASGANTVVVTVSNAATTVSSATSANIYSFANIASDISGYKQLVPLGQFTIGAIGQTSQTVTTNETLLEEFATNLGYPNITTIPIGEIVIHYDTLKASGGQSYYSYAKLYKRSTIGTETLIGTSDISTILSINTQESVDVTVPVTSAITMLPSDRVVVKVYAVMITASSTISVLYDDATSARIEIPVVINLTPRVYTVASTATLTPNISIYDSFEITDQAEALTIANPTGAIGNFEGFIIRLTDNGTSRAISYGNKFRAFGSALPTATTIGKTIYLICIYNSTDDVYDTALREEV